MESVGVKVAVNVAEPAATTVAFEPLTVSTDVLDEEYVNKPGTDDVGAVIAYVPSPNVFVTGAHENVGVACPMETVPFT